MSQLENFRRQAPSALPPHPIVIPTARETVLTNGLTVLVVEEPRLDSCLRELNLKRVGNSPMKSRAWERV